MALLLVSVLTLLISEYGFRSRARILEGFTENWRLRPTFVRFILWILVLIASNWGPAGFLAVGLGFILGEMGAVILRRRLRIDIEKGMLHGYPLTHFIPFMVGFFYFVLSQFIRTLNQGDILAARIEIGASALLVIFSVTALWGWATMVTVSVVDLVRPGQVQEELDKVGAGEVIGVLERLATFVLVATGAFTAVGFVIAAKAAARFPLFKEKAFAEYFLIGTLTSVGLALLLGLLVLTAR